MSQFAAQPAASVIPDELLYGADDPKPSESTEPQDDRQQDMMIHGSVKHRF